MSWVRTHSSRRWRRMSLREMTRNSHVLHWNPLEGVWAEAWNNIDFAFAKIDSQNSQWNSLVRKIIRTNSWTASLRGEARQLCSPEASCEKISACWWRPRNHKNKFRLTSMILLLASSVGFFGSHSMGSFKWLILLSTWRWWMTIWLQARSSFEKTSPQNTQRATGWRTFESSGGDSGRSSPICISQWRYRPFSWTNFRQHLEHSMLDVLNLVTWTFVISRSKVWFFFIMSIVERWSFWSSVSPIPGTVLSWWNSSYKHACCWKSLSEKNPAQFSHWMKLSAAAESMRIIYA